MHAARGARVALALAAAGVIGMSTTSLVAAQDPKWDQVENIKEAATRLAQMQRTQGATKAFVFIDACYRTHSLSSDYTKAFEACIAQDYLETQILALIYSRMSPDALKRMGAPTPRACWRERWAGASARPSPSTRSPSEQIAAFKRNVDEHGFPLFFQSLFPDAKMPVPKDPQPADPASRERSERDPREEVTDMAKPLPKSHYVGPGAAQAIVSRTLSVLVDNEPGVLARVIGLFSGRGYNIDCLTVTETEHEKHLSRITIVTSGTPDVIEQIKHQLERLVPVHRVRDLTVEADALERELALIKVSGKGEKRIEALRIAEIFRAQVVDTSTEHFVFELTGKPSKIEQFIQIMTELGLVEVSRTGIAAIGRGPASV